jgi:hypothetical protein
VRLRGHRRPSRDVTQASGPACKCAEPIRGNHLQVRRANQRQSPASPQRRLGRHRIPQAARSRRRQRRRGGRARGRSTRRSARSRHDEVWEEPRSARERSDWPREVGAGRLRRAGPRPEVHREWGHSGRPPRRREMLLPTRLHAMREAIRMGRGGLQRETRDAPYPTRLRRREMCPDRTRFGRWSAGVGPPARRRTLRRPVPPAASQSARRRAGGPRACAPPAHSMRRPKWCTQGHQRMAIWNMELTAISGNQRVNQHGNQHGYQRGINSGTQWRSVALSGTQWHSTWPLRVWARWCSMGADALASIWRDATSAVAPGTARSKAARRAAAASSRA